MVSPCISVQLHALRNQRLVDLNRQPGLEADGKVLRKRSLSCSTWERAASFQSLAQYQNRRNLSMREDEQQVRRMRSDKPYLMRGALARRFPDVGFYLLPPRMVFHRSQASVRALRLPSSASGASPARMKPWPAPS